MKKYKFQTKMNRKDFFRIQNKTVLLLFMVLFTAILPGQNNPKELFEQANECTARTVTKKP
jgi:hypothetical protein